MRYALPFVLSLLAACASASSHNAPPTTPANAPPQAIPDEVRAAVDASDRSEADRALDRGRHPAEVLAFFNVRRGQRVAELFVGGGYTTELLARAVGPQGQVFAQNNRFILERFAEAPWSARLQTPAMRNVVRVDREFDDPLPPEAANLDAVIMVLTYHDTVWLHADRAAMNRAIFRALKPGGVYGIVDHNAADGHGTNDVQTLHRIERAVVIDEVRAAGFRLDAESDALRSPADTRDWNASPREAGERRGMSDRFMLRFVRP